MKKIFSILFALALVLSFSLVVTTPVAAAGTWYVDGTSGVDNDTHGAGPGANAFKTIQYAINDGRVISGDTINVAAGTYTEDLIIAKALTLQGAGRETTTIMNSSENMTMVQIESSNVRIDGFKISGRGSLPYLCKYIIVMGDGPFSGLWITNCHLLNCWRDAIQFRTASPSGVSNCKANNNIIEHWGDPNNPGYRGIVVYRMLDVEIKNNILRDANPCTYAGDTWTYSHNGIYLMDYSSATIQNNTITRCWSAIYINSNVGETWVDGNTITECHRGIAEVESFAKVHITNNNISVRKDPSLVAGNGFRQYIYGISLGGDGDWYNSCNPYPWEVDNLQHEVRGNTITGTGITTHPNSYGIRVQPGMYDEDYGASGTVTDNTISGFNTGIKVYGKGNNMGPDGPDPGTADRTSHVHVSFANNDITGCQTDAAEGFWTGAAGSINAENNWWGHTTGPDSISDKYDYTPWTCEIATFTETGTASFTPDAGTITQLEARSVPAGAPVVFPHGMFRFTVTGLSSTPPLQTVTITIELPGAVPVGTKWWKYQNGSWYSMDIGSDNGDNIITVRLTDNGSGDEDSTPGQIRDDGGAGNLGVGWETYPINKVRVLLPWIALFAAIIVGASLLVLRRRRIQS